MKKGDRERERRPSSPRSGRDSKERPRWPDGGMRIVVPLQGVVQGRGGLVLGSLIPCALFYFLQLYIKRNRPPPTSPGSPSSAEATSSNSNPAAVAIHRTLSRSLPALSARGAVARAGDDDSLYYAGLRRCGDDPYHPAFNPFGVIQRSLEEIPSMGEVLRRWRYHLC